MVTALAGSLYSCVNVDKLSDENTIESFTVISHSPSSVILGEAVIGDDAITIPVKYGTDKFPIKLTGEVGYSRKVDITVGADPTGELVFGSFDDKKEFYVMAESGLSRKYVISLVEAEYSVSHEIAFEPVSVTPGDAMIYGKARIEGEELLIPVIDPQFPVTVVPRFFGDDIGFEGFENGKTAFVFDDTESAHTISVIDESTGAQRDFALKIGILELVSGADGDYETTDLFNSEFGVSLTSGQEGFELRGFQIENDRDSVSVYISRTAEAEFPVEAELSFRDAIPCTGFMGMPDNGKITFADFGEPFRYYSVDTENMIVRHWQVVPVEYRERGGADVLSFSYRYDENYTINTNLTTKKPPIVLDKESVEIYPQSGQIWLKATEIYTPWLLGGTWKLELTDVEITLSEGADWAGGEQPVFNWRGNNSWQTGIAFEVVSSDGRIKEWSLNIRDYRDYEPSGLAELEDAAINTLLPLMAKADPLVPVTLDRDGRVIYIRLAEDEECYPLSVGLDYELSDFAEVTSQDYNRELMVFATPETVNEVVIRAEDGTEAVWQARLIRPAKEAAADVNVFSVTSFYSPVFEVYSVSIDREDGVITVALDRSGSCPARMNYSMSLSRNATADVPLTGSFDFENLNDTAEFTVTSSGGVEKGWTVGFAPHTPQLRNSNFEEWTSDGLDMIPTGAKGTPYWTNANNFAVKGTKRGPGNGGGYGAKLTTETAMDRLTSGSMFLGWFDSGNVLAGLTDPVVLTFQGIEFAASKKLVGIEMDVNYSSGGDGSDTGIVSAEMVKQSPYNPNTYVYHGKRPDGVIHPANTAVAVARGETVISNRSGLGEDLVIPAGTWRTIRVDIDYRGNDPMDYTHFVIMCASSSRGDAFIGQVGTELLLDNVKLIYE